MSSRPSRNQRRVSGSRPVHKVLLVCEDKKSGRDYLKSFQSDAALVEIETLGGIGDPQTVVERAIAEKQSAVVPYAEVWAVFDRDSFPRERWAEAFRLAEKEGVRVAYANPCFELWYLLHFVYRDTHIERDDLFSLLKTKDYLGEYDKGATPVRGLLDKRGKGIESARRVAKKLMEGQGRRRTRDENPSLSLHHLVARLCELQTWREPPGADPAEGVDGSCGS